MTKTTHETLPEGSGPCAKRVVTATLITIEGNKYVGTNWCATPQTVCPRETQGFAAGEGYHLCKSICNQRAHAEVNAISLTLETDSVVGSTIHVDHEWICSNCSSTAHKHGATVTTDFMSDVEDGNSCDYCYQAVHQCSCVKCPSA